MPLFLIFNVCLLIGVEIRQWDDNTGNKINWRVLLKYSCLYASLEILILKIWGDAQQFSFFMSSPDDSDVSGM